MRVSSDRDTEHARVPPVPGGRGSDRSPFAPAAPPFVGRVEEILVLTTALDEALAGRGQIVLLVGEPGIGKSRTAEEMARRAAQRGVEVLVGRCWEEEGAPAFWPWVEAIRTYARARDDAELRAVLGAEGGDLAQLVREIHERFPGQQATPSRDGESARFRLFDSMAIVLRRAAEKRPLLIVLEDLHGADRASLLFLRFLARGVGESRLLVVGTLRDVALLRQNPLAETLGELVREPASRTVSLRGLGMEDVERFVEAFTHVSPPPQLVAKLQERSAGNPLFLTEIVRSLASRAPAETWGSVADVAIPTGVRAAVLRRLANLSRPCADMLRLAAGLGRQFREDVIARAAGLASRQLAGLLVEALDASLLEALPNRGGWLRFTHALVRDVVYEDTPAPLRGALHLRLADAMEQVASSDADPPFSELAAQFLLAGDLRAVGYARRAGDHALGLLAYEEAARLYETGLQALDRTTPHDEATRCDLLLARGDALSLGSDTAGSRDAFLRAAESARRRGAREQLSEAALGLGPRSLVSELGYVDATHVALLEEALSTWGDEDADLHVELLADLATALYLSPGTESRRAELAGRGVAMARRLGVPDCLARALHAQRLALWAAGNARERLVIADEQIRVAEAARDLRLAFEGHFSRFHDYLELGNGPALEADFDACLRLSADLREPYHAVCMMDLRATRALMAGRWQEAEGLVGALQDLGQRGWRRGAADVIGCILWQCAADRGYIDLAVTLCRQVLEQPTAVKPQLRSMIACLCAAAGRTAEARAEYGSVMDGGLSALPADYNLLLVLSQLAETCRALDDERGAALLYDALVPYAGLCIGFARKPGFLGAVSLYLGMLAAMLSRRKEAARHLEDALAAHARVGAAPWLARTQAEYAALLHAQEDAADRGRGRTLLAEARATAETLGMRSLLPRVHALAERADGSSAPASSTPSVAPAPGRSAEGNVFRREGEYWTLAYDGTSIRLRDTKGLGYVACLLAHPGREIHVAALALRDAGDRAQEHDLGAVLDPRATAEYKQRVGDLREELEEATAAADLGRAARAREEIEAITHELSAAYGLGGRARRAGDRAERLRKAVTNQIRRTVERIRKDHPSLGRHLMNALRTGLLCAYLPEQLIEWLL
jgi:predicted ATPase